MSALLVLALAARLASLFPGAPAPHWHGAVFAVTPGGAYPHPYGSEGCEDPARGGNEPGDDSAGFAYFCALHAPLEPGMAATLDRDAPPATGETVRGGGVSFGSLVPGIRDPRAPPAGLDAEARASESDRTNEFIRNRV